MGRKGKAGKTANSAGKDSASDSKAQDAAGAEGSTAADPLSAALDDPSVADVVTLLKKLQLDEASATAEKLFPSDGGKRSETPASEVFKVIDMMKKVTSADGLRFDVSLHDHSSNSSENEKNTRGRGLVTTRTFKQGETVISEAPFLVSSMDLVRCGSALSGSEIGKGFDKILVQQVYSSLQPWQMWLLNAFQADLAPEAEVSTTAKLAAQDAKLEPLLRLARLMKLNAHEYYAEPGKAALYMIIARANHSCDPCCILSSGPNGCLVFKALRDLEAGEEITYSYLGGHLVLHPTQARRDLISRAKLFHCYCSRCTAETDDMRNLSCTSVDGKATDDEDADRLARVRKLEPLLLTKLSALESKWHDPEKDVSKYIRDWEALAKSCGQALGSNHCTYARACYFALQALNTGRSLGVGDVDAARHASGLQTYGIPLVRFLKKCSPTGARRVLLEPVGSALIILSTERSQNQLVSSVIQEAGCDELSVPLFDDARNGKLKRLLLSWKDEQ